MDNHHHNMTMTMAPSASTMPMMMKHKMMMHMTFFWGSRVEILFSGWPGDKGVGIYLLALVVVFALAFLVELLYFLPPRLLLKQDQRRRAGVAVGLLMTAVTGVRTGMSYVVMLAVMSFNVGVLLVAVAGHALGFFVFGSGVVIRRGGGGGGEEIGNKC